MDLESKIAMRQAIIDIQEMFNEHIQLSRIKAKLIREYYEELLEQGFSETEALELSKHFKIGA